MFAQPGGRNCLTTTASFWGAGLMYFFSGREDEQEERTPANPMTMISSMNNDSINFSLNGIVLLLSRTDNTGMLFSTTAILFLFDRQTE